MTRDRAPPAREVVVEDSPFDDDTERGSGEKVEPKEFKSSSKPLMMIIELDEGRGGSRGCGGGRKGASLQRRGRVRRQRMLLKEWSSSIGVSLQRIIPQS